jgi:hypothetical protein
MKSIKEKEMLVKWAKAMNEPIDPALVEEVEKYQALQKSILESVKQNLVEDLVKASKDLVVTINDVPSVPIEFPKLPSLDDLQKLLEEETNELVQSQTEQASKTSQPTPDPVPETIVNKVIDHITKEVKLEEKADSYQQPDTSVPRNINDIKKKIKYLEDWIAKISLAGPGGGEVNLRFLDDVNTRPYNLKDPILRQQADGLAVVYNAANNKFELSVVASGGAANVSVLDEGVYLTNSVTSLNFTGTGVTATNSGSVVTIDIPRYYVTTSDTAPSTPQDGELWYDTASAVLFIWLVENNVGQWVDVTGGTTQVRTTTLITAPSYNVSTTDEYVGVNYNGPVTINAPTATYNGRIIVIKDESGNCSTNPITITGNIDNDAGGAILKIDNGALQLLYRNGWRII